MGWREGSGLGSRGDGIVGPVSATITAQTTQKGLGFVVTPVEAKNRGEKNKWKGKKRKNKNPDFRKRKKQKKESRWLFQFFNFVCQFQQKMLWAAILVDVDFSGT